MIEDLKRRHDELVGLLHEWHPTHERTRLNAELRELRKQLGKDEHEPLPKHFVPRHSRRLCFACAGLPHRRPRRGCHECGGKYQSEPPVTLSEVMDRGRGESRVFPEGVGFK